MFFHNEENNSDIFHPIQICTHPPDFIADLCVGMEVTWLNQSSFFDTVLIPKGADLEMKGPSLCGKDTSCQGAKNEWIATFCLAVYPNNMPRSGQIVFSLNYAFLQTLWNRRYPSIPTISFSDLLCLISNQNKILSYLSLLTNLSLVIKISREDKAQFHSARELTSRHHRNG